jgi:hypothetical protein
MGIRYEEVEDRGVEKIHLCVMAGLGIRPIPYRDAGMGYKCIIYVGPWAFTYSSDDLESSPTCPLHQHQHCRKHKHNGARREDMHHGHPEDRFRRMVTPLPRLH